MVLDFLGDFRWINRGGTIEDICNSNVDIGLVKSLIINHRDIGILYQVFIHVPYLREPEECSKFSDCLDQGKNVVLNKVVNVKDVNLSDNLQLPANERVCILSNVVSLHRLD